MPKATKEQIKKSLVIFWNNRSHQTPRKFGAKFYYLWSYAHGKGNADFAAENARELGYNARIVETDKEYEIWIDKRA